MPTPIKVIRILHLYSGVFLAPAILFFAITGALQTFGLHEAERGSSYKPSLILQQLSQLHKHSTIQLPVRRTAPPELAHTEPAHKAPEPTTAQSPTPVPAATPQAPKPAPPQRANHYAMKIFFAIVACGLLLSTFTGLFMSWKFSRRKSFVVATFLAGIIVPVAILFLDK